jgi:hypothetical protein
MNSLFAVNKIAVLAHDARGPKLIRAQETEEGNDMAKAAAKAKSVAKKKAPMKKPAAKKRTAKAS